MITQRAFLVAVMGFCFYLILLFNTNLPSQFYVLTWLSVGVLLSCFGVALLTLSGLHCRWQVGQTRAAEELTSSDELGGGPTVELEVGNSGSLHKTDLMFVTRLRAVPGGELHERIFLIEALPGGASLEATLPICDLPRGRYRLDSVALHASDVLGLFKVRRRLVLTGQDSDFIVGPGHVVLPRDGLMGGAGMGGRVARSHGAHGQGDEFRGTRLYVPGDDLRTVHWKSTARKGQLVVREFHEPDQCQHAVVWDGAPANRPSTEFSLRLTMSLARALSELGRPSALLRLDTHPLFLPPPRGARHADVAAVAEALADATAGRATGLDAAMGPFIRQLGALGEVFIVTGQTGEPVIRAALLLRSRGLHPIVAVVSMDGADGRPAELCQALRVRGVRAVTVRGDGVPLEQLRAAISEIFLAIR